MDASDLPIRDIQLPDAVTWFPPAPGWWLLAGLVVAGLAVWLAWRRQRRRRWIRREGLRTLHALRERYAASGDSAELATALSVTLRRVALSYLPRDEVAGLTGEAWLQRLESLSGLPETQRPAFRAGVGEMLLIAPYSASPHYDATALLDLCEDWLKALPPWRGGVR